MVRRIAIFVVAGFLSACSTAPGQSVVTKLKVKFRVDLAVAEKIAIQQGDIISSTCYRALLDRLPVDKQKIKPVGVISKLQVVAGLKHKFQAGISDELELACAAKHNRLKKIKMNMGKAILRRGL